MQSISCQSCGTCLTLASDDDVFFLKAGCRDDKFYTSEEVGSWPALCRKCAENCPLVFARYDENTKQYRLISNKSIPHPENNHPACPNCKTPLDVTDLQICLSHKPLNTIQLSNLLMHLEIELGPVFLEGIINDDDKCLSILEQMANTFLRPPPENSSSVLCDKCKRHIHNCSNEISSLPAASDNPPSPPAGASGTAVTEPDSPTPSAAPDPPHPS